jgi:hypothetical protein
VREEALAAYCKIRGLEAEKHCLALLHDPDVGVKKRAIQCLATMRSRHGLDLFVSMLRRREERPEGKAEFLETRLFSALGFYENVERAVLSSVEDLLVELLERHLAGGGLKFLKKKKDSLSDDAIVAICDTLGKIGSTNSCAALEKLGKQDGSWKEHTEGPLAKIAERAAQQAQGNASQPH